MTTKRIAELEKQLRANNPLIDEAIEELERNEKRIAELEAEVMRLREALKFVEWAEYDASRADLEQRLSEADKVIKIAKEDLLTFSRTGKSEWAYEALAAIEAYEKGEK